MCRSGANACAAPVRRSWNALYHIGPARILASLSGIFVALLGHLHHVALRLVDEADDERAGYAGGENGAGLRDDGGEGALAMPGEAVEPRARRWDVRGSRTGLELERPSFLR